LHETRAITTQVWIRAFLVVALIVIAPAAEAAWEVSVKARTELRLKPIRKDYDGAYVLSGQLVDRFSGEGLGQERVELEIAGQRIVTFTSDDGTFTARVQAPGGKQDIDVRFEGSDLLDPAQVRLDDVDVDKNPVDLRITTAAEAGGVRVTIDATAADVRIELPVDLRIGPVLADPGDLKKIATVTAGGAPFVITRAAAGGPGQHRVRAVFAGDSVYNPATADATIELGTATTTTMQLRSREVAYEDDVVASGKVVDEDGAGVARASVALVSDNRRVAQTVTGKDGTFRFRVEAEAIGQGESQLQSSVEPTEGWMRGSSSEVIQVTVAAPQPVPIAYTIAAFAITALVAAGFFAARSKPWQKLRTRPRDEGERAPLDTAAEPAGGLQLARPSLISTLRRPGDLGFAGVVRDAIRHRALPGARVVVRRGEQVLDGEAGPDGGFGFENLAPGEWRAEVTLRGHVTERFALTVPHRGELRGVRVDLMPVRERIFSLYKRAALPALPDPARWGIWSPRQVFDHVRSRRPAKALADLTDFVENAYFSGIQPDEDRLPEAEGKVEAALREQVV
jgi:hypothetical protein